MNHLITFEADPRYNIRVSGHWELGTVDLLQGDRWVSIPACVIQKLIGMLQDELNEFERLDREVEQYCAYYEAYLSDPMRMTNQKFYAVGALHKSVMATIIGEELSIPLSWRDGMIGMMPVFDSREAAEAEAGEKYGVIEFGAEDSCAQTNSDVNRS